MTRNTKRTQRARAAVYYFSIIVSLGLIWGGGMSLLRGGIVEGIIAIFLGILLQLGLKRFRMDKQESRPKFNERGANTEEQFYDADEMAATPTSKDMDETPAQAQQKTFQREATRGTDGATLLLDSNSRLDLPHKFEKGKTDET